VGVRGVVRGLGGVGAQELLVAAARARAPDAVQGPGGGRARGAVVDAAAGAASGLVEIVGGGEKPRRGGCGTEGETGSHVCLCVGVCRKESETCSRVFVAGRQVVRAMV
jgi:hypothetical protein